MTHVTEVLDYLTEPELLNWMLRTSKAKREASSNEALAIGKEVDKLIQTDLFPTLLTTSPPTLAAPLAAKVDSCMKAWAEFKAVYPDIVAGIKSVQDELAHGGIVGHPDLFYEDDNRWGIIDVKTSQTMYPRYWTQTAKYTDLKRMSFHTDHYIRKPRFIGVLRLDKESGRFHYASIEVEAAIQYEVSVFEAYRVAYAHNYKLREIIRSQLELEVLK